MSPTARPRRRTVVVTSCLVAALALGGGGWALAATLTGPAAVAATGGGADATAATTTAPVTRGDLTETRVFSGTLGHGAPVGVPGLAHGTITWLPAPGQEVHRDEPLYAVDERPVRSMHGTVPLWRSLERGRRGADVAQLNVNLAALGYDVATDDAFGARTAAAVERWQRDRHLPVTGRIDADQVAFVDGDVRVASVPGQLGAPAGGVVLEVTTTGRVVTASVGQQDADRLPVGATVTVLLNGTGEPLTGTVVDAAPGEGTAGGPPTVDVTVAIEGTGLDLPAAASAQLTVAGRTEAGVLSVPVAALVAGPDGGFAVDVRRGDAVERVDVTVGFVADGRAAVEGDLAEGDPVVVPA